MNKKVMNKNQNQTENSRSPARDDKKIVTFIVIIFLIVISGCCGSVDKQAILDEIDSLYVCDTYVAYDMFYRLPKKKYIATCNCRWIKYKKLQP